MSEQRLPDELLDPHVKIEETDWQIECNAYGRYWVRHKRTRRVIGLPWWIEKLIFDVRTGTEKTTTERVRREVRDALGIKLPRARKAKQTTKEQT